MKKIKKILLAFAPFTTIAIATPIVLTSCSGTSTNTTTPGGDAGGNGGAENNVTKPTFTPDATNSKDFSLKSDSEAQKILDQYKNAQGEDAANKVLDDALKGFPKKDSKTLAQDVLNMWSNNNWFLIKNNAQDSKVKETFISSLNINKAEVGSDSKASFDVEYKTAFNDTNGKLYEATQLLKADKLNVDASTTKIDVPKEVPTDGYKINGEVQTIPSAVLVETATDPKTNLENMLKQKVVSLDAKQVFKTYITNHGIKHADKPAVNAPVWNKAEVDKDTSLKYTSDSEIVMQLTGTGNPAWGNCVTTTPYANILSTMKGTTYSNKIKALITSNDYENPTLEYGPEIKNTSDSDMNITVKFTKKASVVGDDTKPTLTFKIKGFKKTA